MKSILMSIKPKLVAKIASGEKTVEVRKSVPKCGTAFKVYIYCTYGRPLLMRSFYDGKSLFKFSGVSNKDAKVIYDEELWNGKVVGEFVCDLAADIEVLDSGAVRNYWHYDIDKSCLSIGEVASYLGKGKKGYGLHISDLKIYDKPKALSEFKHEQKCFCSKKRCIGKPCEHKPDCMIQIPVRVPQSWCYVEDID